MDLLALISKVRWSPRSVFPPSRPLGGRIFTCGEGWYLMTNPKFGDGDPVRAVGWAQSDYWARRAWEVPPFSEDLVPAPPQWDHVPSLQVVGRPTALSFGNVRNFERAQPGAKTVTLVDARYRMTDGAFLYCAVHGTDGITYIYESNEPGPSDLPVAIEFKLQENS